MVLNQTKVINARNRLGLNQEELAELAEVSAPTIRRAEGGEGIHPSTGKRICGVLHIELADTVLPIEEAVP